MSVVLRSSAVHRCGGSRPLWGVSSASRPRLWLAAQVDRYRRAQRFRSDRRHLLELDARLLADVGLTREDILRNVPFRHGSPDVPRPNQLAGQSTLEAGAGPQRGAFEACERVGQILPRGQVPHQGLTTSLIISIHNM